MAVLDLSIITDGELTGTGVFDKLMAASAAHIQEEFKKNRVKGPEYAALYTANIQSAMDQSIRYALEYRNADLIAKQIEKTEKEIEMLDAEIALTQIKANLTEQQRQNAIEEKAKIIAEANLIQIRANLTEQERQNAIETKAKIIAETNLTQIRANLTEQERQNAIIQGELLGFQKNKIEAERQLLVQKKQTESAQTQDNIATSASVIGRQNALYQAQTAGYARDAEQKVMKIMTDTWSLRHTNDPEGNGANTANHFDDTSIGKIVQKSLGSVGVSV